MTPVCLEAVGICATGLCDWAAARPVLAGTAAFAPSPMPRLAATALPPTERRRANTTARWALEAAGEAVRALPVDAVAALPTVFASADGDGEVLATVLRDLSQEPVTVSPTTFHNSVFNAPAGYWSIAAHAPAPSTTLCADAASFAAGLLEAAAQTAETRGQVLLVAYDHPFPAASPIGTPVRAAFACALLLAPRDGTRAPLGRIDGLSIATGTADPLPADWSACFAGNAAACALPLLRAVARNEPASVTLPYFDETQVVCAWSPCA